MEAPDTFVVDPIAPPEQVPAQCSRGQLAVETQQAFGGGLFAFRQAAVSAIAELAQLAQVILGDHAVAGVGLQQQRLARFATRLLGQRPFAVV